MDNDRYVPIRVLASFPKVAALTDKEVDIVEAVRGSASLQVDEDGTRVRPVAKRCTIILRDIPETTPPQVCGKLHTLCIHLCVQTVEALFTNLNATSSVLVEYSGVNNVWYASFATEEDSQLALRHLHTKVKTFNGKPIFARLKAGRAPHSPMVEQRPFSAAAPTGMLSPQPQTIDEAVCPSISRSSTLVHSFRRNCHLRNRLCSCRHRVSRRHQ
jgi:la-related protein 4